MACCGASPALSSRLAAAQAELERLESVKVASAAPVADVSLLLADLPTLATRAVEKLEQTLALGDVTRARQEIRDHVGMVSVEADDQEIRLYSDQGNVAAVRLRATGSHASLYGSGGGFELGLTLPAILLASRAWPRSSGATRRHAA